MSDEERILLSHGAGGQRMRELIEGTFLEILGSPLPGPPTDAALLFKMRATNLQRYVCRPNFGVIQGGDAQEIQVLLSYEELDGKVKGGNTTTRVVCARARVDVTAPGT